MKKKIISILVMMSLLLQVPLCAFALKDGYHAGPITYELTAEYCVEMVDATLNGNAIAIQNGGKASYGFYLPFDAGSVTFEFEADGVPITISNGEETSTATPNENETTLTHTLPTVWRLGEKEVTFTAGGSATINKIIFNKKALPFTDTYPNQFPLPDLSDEEYAVQGAVLINEKASAIMAKGSTRYINADNPREIPKEIDGRIYIPAHTLARAFGAYHEEMEDKGYVLLREPLSKAEIMLTPEQSYIEKDGVKTQINYCTFFENGKAYLPVRLVAETFDLFVDYYDGLVAIDDNRYYVNDELYDSKIRGYIDGVLRPFIPSGGGGKVYHVAQTATASDNNPGTLEMPFRTICKAGEVVTAGDTVIVHNGTYRETVTVKNNGQPTKPIVFKAAEGEEVVISALDVIDGFGEYEDGIYVASYPWDLGVGRNQVFYNSSSIPEARYPNGPGIETGDTQEPISDNWPVVGDLVTDPDNNTVVTSETLLDQEEEDYWKGSIFVTARGYNYAMNSAVVESSKKGELKLDSASLPKYFWDKGIVGKHNWGYLVGHRNALDAPGEWIIENGVLFVIPPKDADVDNLIMEGKRRQLVADLTNNKYIQFRGFTTIGGSMKMNNSEMCVVDDCTIRYNNHFILSKDQHSGFIDDGNVNDTNGAPARGEVGLYVGGKNNVFTNNVFEEAAGAAIYGVGLYTYIENNYIDSCGYAGSYVAGLNFINEAWKGKTAPTGGHLIVKNTAFNAGRSPLQITRPAGLDIWPMVPWEIAYNEFYDGTLASDDTGVTYTYYVDHGNSRIKSKMHNNLVYYTPSQKRFGISGIYHDGGTQNIDTFENVIFTTHKDVSILYPTIAQPVVAAIAICNMWNNSYNEGVTGGRDGVLPEHYPRGVKPFDAGCTLNREPYMVNYDGRNLEYDASLLDKDVILPDGFSDKVLKNDDGSYNIKDSGQWVKFEDVDLTGITEIEIFYGGDKYLLDAKKGVINIILDELSSSASYRCADINVSTTYREFSLTSKSRSLPFVDGVHDVYLRFDNFADINVFGIKLNTQAQVEGHTNIVYGGNFSSFTVEDTSRSPGKNFHNKDLDNPFVNDVWDGTTLTYNNVTIENETNEIIVNYCTAAPFEGQTIQIRLGSLDSEPIAELVTENVGWGVWDKETVIPLNRTVKQGVYDLYVTFEDEGGKSCNLYYINFANPNEVTVTK